MRKHKTIFRWLLNKTTYFVFCSLYFLIAPFGAGFIPTDFSSISVKCFLLFSGIGLVAFWGAIIYNLNSKIKKVDIKSQENELDLLDDIYWYVLIITFALSWNSYYQKFPSAFKYNEYFFNNEWEKLTDIFPSFITGIFIALVTYIVSTLIKNITKINDSYRKFNFDEIEKTIFKMNKTSLSLKNTSESLTWVSTFFDIERRVKKQEQNEAYNNINEVFENNFKPALNKYLTNLGSQINTQNYTETKNKEEVNAGSILSTCMLSSLSVNLDYQSEYLNTIQKSIYTNFGCYAKICQQIISSFRERENNDIEFHTLLLLEPKSFFNNETKYESGKKIHCFTKEWKEYIDSYYLFEKQKVTRYFLINDLQYDKNDNFHYKTVSSHEFEVQLKMKINLGDFYDEEGPKDFEHNYFTIGNGNENNHNEKLITIKDALEKFHKHDADNKYLRKIVLCKGSDFAEKYFVRNDFFKNDQNMPLDFFAIKYKGNFLFAIIVESIDEYNDKVKLSIYHNQISSEADKLWETWKKLQAYFLLIEDKSSYL